MLILFKVVDPAKPDAPAREHCINESAIVIVEPLYDGEKDGEGNPIYIPTGSVIHTTDKRKFRVAATPKQVHRAFKTGVVEGA
jgi:hypothetical protein